MSNLTGSRDGIKTASVGISSIRAPRCCIFERVVIESVVVAGSDATSCVTGFRTEFSRTQ